VASEPTRDSKSTVIAAGIVFVLLMVAYLAPAGFTPGHDATANVHLAANFALRGKLTFTPLEDSSIFKWSHLANAGGDTPARVRDGKVFPGGDNFRVAFDSGKLKLGSRPYYLVPTVQTDVYANTFGPGAGLFAAPFFLAARAIAPNLLETTEGLWTIATFAAAAAVAGSALFLFLTGAPRLGVLRATLITLAYGLGTCVFSVSSQALWQHGPGEFFLGLGGFLLLRGDPERPTFWTGLTLAAAAACRPPLGIVCCSVALFLLIQKRGPGWRYVLGAAIPVTMLAVYNWILFGSPIAFGQTADTRLAVYKTGSESLWQTPLWEGALGLLISPSRGLLIFSPIVMVALWGGVKAFSRNGDKAVRPIFVSVLVLWVVAFKHFDWWGGWSFGYRPIVDTMILSAFVAIPIVDSLWIKDWARWCCVPLLAWSITVQLLGAFAYDLYGWNNRAGYACVGPGPDAVTFIADVDHLDTCSKLTGTRLLPVHANIDLALFRNRLWSWHDSQILYYLRNWEDTRMERKKACDAFIADEG
jgi:hypothetical protein